MIGIGVTTHNRAEVAQYTIEQIKRFTSKHKLVVVDDASEIPFPSAFRFNENVGIAAAKNKCLELLEDCEHLFLFDDDTHPQRLGWEWEYINSGELHLCMTFSKLANGAQNGNRVLMGHHGKLPYYQNPCGCMLYIHRSCIEKVGGFDTDLKFYSFEHVNLSQRIHNAGLTKFPFMDIPNSKEWIYSRDYHRMNPLDWSMSPQDRLKWIKHNRPIYEAKKSSKEFISYK